jgi:methionyl-tRNA formyltransferase
LVARQLGKPVESILTALHPDLLISATFPLRIPQEITTIPRYGALNLHASALPAGRGPNPLRLVYEGHPTLAATLHRISAEFDAGAVLCQREQPRPDDLTTDLLSASITQLLAEVLEEGTTRAIRGEYGDPQPEADATYAARFTEQERWLRWNEPGQVIQRKVAALSLPVPTAKAMINGQPRLVRTLRARTDGNVAPPGTVLSEADGFVVVAVPDGIVELSVV